MSNLTPTLRTPMGRVRGLGSARSGTGHFWHQRLTAVANIPLMLAFMAVVAAAMGADYARARAIVGSPLVGIVLLLFIGSISYHMSLGLTVVAEDYVHDDRLKVVTLMAIRFFAIVIGATCAYAILRIGFGA